MRQISCLLLKGSIVVQMSTDGLTDHGVLSHEDLSVSSEGHTDLLHLLGSDIVNSNDEALGELVQKVLITKICKELINLPHILHIRYCSDSCEEGEFKKSLNFLYFP